MRSRLRKLEDERQGTHEDDHEREKRLRMAREGAERCNDSHRRDMAIYRRKKLLKRYGSPETINLAGVDASDAALTEDVDVPFVIAENGDVFATRNGRPLSDYGQVIAEDSWRHQVEWLSLCLVRGSPPNLALNEEDHFLTLDGRVAISKERSDLQALMGPRTQAIKEMIPLELWGRFLVADDEAADALERLFELANTCVVPDNYAMSISREYTEEETEVFVNSPHRPTALFVDDEEREDVRRLTWALTYNPDARRMLSELARRWVAFIEEEDAIPGNLPTY